MCPCWKKFKSWLKSPSRGRLNFIDTVNIKIDKVYSIIAQFLNIGIRSWSGKRVFWIVIFVICLFILGSNLQKEAAPDMYRNYVFSVYATNSSNQPIDIQNFHFFFDFEQSVGSISFDLKGTNQSNLNRLMICLPKTLSIVDEQITSLGWYPPDKSEAVKSTRGEDFNVIQNRDCGGLDSSSGFLYESLADKFGQMWGVTIQLKGKMAPFGKFKISSDPQSQIFSGGGGFQVISFKLGDYVCADAFCVKDESNLVVDKGGGYINIYTKGVKNITGKEYEIYTVNEKKQGEVALLVSLVVGLLFFTLQLVFYMPKSLK